MEKKYIKTFESFRNSKNVEVVNEELLGLPKFLNFLKGIFKAAQNKIKSLKTYDELKNYVKTGFFGVQSKEYLFSGVFQEYNENPNTKVFNDQTCFEFISRLIDPDDPGEKAKSSLSNKSIQELIAGIDDEKKKKQIQYEIETGRNKALAFFKYGGNSAASFVVGKALPVPAIKPESKSGKFTQRTADGKGFVDQTHLPELKKLIAALPDEAKKKAVMNWVNTVMVKKIYQFVDEIKEEEINKFAGVDDTKQDTDVLGSYGVKEEKELVGKDIYYMMDGYDAKVPKKELIGKGKVTAFDENKGFSIETEKGSKFDKPVDKLLSKVEAEKLLGIKEGEGQGMDYEKLNTIYGEKKEVIYLLPGIEKDKYDAKKKPDEQAEVVGVGQMVGLNDQNNDKSVKFEKDGKTIERSYSDIVGVVGDEEKSEEAKKAAEELGLIKDDPEKMKKVSNYAEFLRKGKEDDVNTIKDLIDDELNKLPKE
jgi:hypothetical protein